MGSAISLPILARACKTLPKAVTELAELEERIETSPGLPVPVPTASYWKVPRSRIADHGAGAVLPEEVDVVIIGSGITGMAVAREYLGLTASSKQLPRVVMLEARDVCSGATARNGGHITPSLYQDYRSLRSRFGVDEAPKIMRFRLAHLDALLQVSKEEGVLPSSQCRRVDSYCVYFDKSEFRAAQIDLALYLRDLPEQRHGWRVLGARECLEELELASGVVGAIATVAGAIHPYRFVTEILARLLDRHAANFEMFAHTPCLSITSSNGTYTLETPRGTIRARQIVHATNAWASHLIPRMRRKIVPVREHMSAHEPNASTTICPSPHDSTDTLANSPTWHGTRSFLFLRKGTYDYLTQQPPAGAVWPSGGGEMMFGRNLTRHRLAQELGKADDGDLSIDTAAYLGGALGLYFQRGEGKDGGRGRVMGIWTGCIAISADEQPWIGRLPPRITGRPVPRGFTRPVGEYIAAGYSGEGMVSAFLSATALARMLLNMPAEIPEPLLVTERRWRNADITDML